MPSYINRTELLNKFNLDCKTAEERYRALAFAPDADVVPVVHGHWIVIDDDYQWDPEQGDEIHVVLECECSECHERTRRDRPNYCDNCGAKMDKEAK